MPKKSLIQKKWFSLLGSGHLGPQSASVTQYCSMDIIHIQELCFRIFLLILIEKYEEVAKKRAKPLTYPTKGGSGDHL
jgi:hypothetical protein